MTSFQHNTEYYRIKSNPPKSIILATVLASVHTRSQKIFINDYYMYACKVKT